MRVRFAPIISGEREMHQSVTRVRCSASLKRVLRVYPEARIKVSDTGLMLLPSKPHVERRSSTSA